MREFLLVVKGTLQKVGISLKILEFFQLFVHYDYYIYIYVVNYIA